MTHHTDTARTSPAAAPVLPRAVPVLFSIVAAASASFVTMEATLRAIVS